jgi:hypothetical protein
MCSHFGHLTSKIAPACQYWVSCPGHFMGDILPLFNQPPSSAASIFIYFTLNLADQLTICLDLDQNEEKNIDQFCFFSYLP